MKVAYTLSILALAIGSAHAADVSSTDKSFMKNAAESGAFEIQGSQLADQTSQNPQVKTFAEKMVADHTKVASDLTALASTKQVTLPTDPSTTQKAKLKLLSKKTGGSFDKSYADGVGVSAHKDTIALFEKEADKGSDPDVKAFAEKNLPALKEHLQMAESLQSSTSGK